MIIKMLNLETVTPMFLHGSTPKVPELRPPPFKSLMRYWWRTVQDCKTESLQKTEACLFGSTEGKAPFSIRISGKTDLAQVSYKPLPHRTDSRGFKTAAYRAGQPFDLYLIAKNESVASTYAQIAKLGFLLGGVGNRSRRGFGSIREASWNFADVFELRSEILDTLNSVADADRFQIKNQIIESKITDDSNFPVIRRIIFGHPTDNSNDLLTKIGQATHNHNDNALGSASPRLASPIHVRVQKLSNGYIPVITQLHSIFPRHEPKQYQQKQKNFIDAIIR
ncbi:MAG: type III-B CRISPR module RAMP protein Cmr1 [Caldilineaceae bacterium]|nr:type III-B CRISPR module RAMP protein Cmr1 [Caldilineaceae bacterium]MDE0630578.1 type III-B CRISPR module RAMP protein Cmr1 [Caldilineaceae bacterium]